MSKATPTEIEAAGFRQEQFGKPSDWNTEGGYLQLVLDDAALLIENKVGSSRYAAASSTGSSDQRLDFSLIRKAEIELASAELWRRREAFDDSTARRNSSDKGTQTIGSRYLANADAAEQRGIDIIAVLTGNYSGSVMVAGGVETDTWSAPA